MALWHLLIHACITLTASLSAYPLPPDTSHAYNLQSASVLISSPPREERLIPLILERASCRIRTNDPEITNHEMCIRDRYWFPMASFMKTRFVIRLKKQWIYAWKLWKNSWLSTRKSNGVNNFPLKFCG